jgi:hypothetical protein
VRVTPSGAYPTEAFGQGWVAMVWTTLFEEVSMTDTSSLPVSVTKREPSAAWSAVGWSPTSMLCTAAVGSAVSMTLTVPVVVAPVKWSAGTWVP